MDDDQQLDVDSESTSFTNRVKKLDDIIGQLSDENLGILLPLLSDWNTNAKYSFVSQAVISSLFRTFKSARLDKNPLFQSFVTGLASYSERHYQRLDKLHEASYLLEFVSGQIGALISN